MGLQHLLGLQISLAPWVVALSIAATRIHRGLVDYASLEEYDINPSHSSRSHLYRSGLVDPVNTTRVNGRTERKANRVPIRAITRTQLSPIEVAIPDMYEQGETSRMDQHGSAGSLIIIEGQLYEKLGGQTRFGENVENGVGSATEGP